MKVSIDEVGVIDLDTALLPAYETKRRGVVRCFVWRRHRREWYDHGPAEGHWEAHCRDQSSPYWRRGTIWRMLGNGGTGRGRRRSGVSPVPGLENIGIHA